MTDQERKEAQPPRAPGLELLPLLARAVAAASEHLERPRVIATFLERVVGEAVAAAAVHVARAGALVLAGHRNVPAPGLERLMQVGLADGSSAVARVAREQEHVAMGEGPLLERVPGASLAFAAPLIGHGRLEGVLTLWLRGMEELPEQALRLMRTAADAFGAVLGSCEARERADREVRQMQSLEAAALEIAGPLELRPVLQRIVDHARALAHGSYASLGVLADGDPHGPFSAVVESGELPRRQPPEGAQANGHWLEQLIAPLCGGLSAIRVAELPSPEQTAYGIRSFIAVSIRYADLPLGYLFVANRLDSEAFDCDDQRALELLAQHAAIAVAHAREHEQLLEAIQERERSEHALLESERRFRRLAENVPDVIFRLELVPRPRFEYISRAVRHLLGHPAEAYLEDVELPLRQIHPLDRHRLREALEHPQDGGHGVLLRCTHADGRKVWVEARFAAVRDEAGRLVAVEGVARDVSDAKRAEAEIQTLLERMRGRRAWLETVIDHSPVGIVLIEDPQGLRIRANREAQQLFGRPLEPTGGIDQLIPQIRDGSRNPMHYDQLVSVRALQGEKVQLEESICDRPDGRVIPVLVSGTPITDARGNVEGAVLIYRDITVLKELERLREEWTSIIAHDLRQPVNVIALQAHLLVRGARERRTRQRAEHILGGSRKLMRMIDDLLDFSRIESRNLEIRPESVALEPLAKEIVERLEQNAGGRRIRLITRGGPLRLSADPDRLEQVLTNLISNAIKYGAPGTDVEVLAESSREGVHVAVTNRGEGIPASELPDLFRKFHRTHRARSGKTAGLGLGLYISRGLIEAHGGKMWAESTPGDRTTFHFVLPVERESVRPAPH